MQALILTAPGIAFAGAYLYSAVRPWPVAAEILASLGALFLLPALGVPLSYAGASLAMPLQDDTFAAIDAALGFEWLSYAKWCASVPWLDTLQRLAYNSQISQAFLTVPVLAAWAPGRNREMLVALYLSLAATIVIFALLPTLGPAELHGFSTPQGAIITALRDGVPGPHPYAGIISFPSYHTAMAVLFTLAHRGLPTFWPVAALNLLMLTAIPNIGDHYLTDMIAGVGVAIAGILLSGSRSAGTSALLQPSRPNNSHK